MGFRKDRPVVFSCIPLLSRASHFFAFMWPVFIVELNSRLGLCQITFGFYCHCCHTTVHSAVVLRLQPFTDISSEQTVEAAAKVKHKPLGKVQCIVSCFYPQGTSSGRWVQEKVMHVCKGLLKMVIWLCLLSEGSPKCCVIVRWCKVPMFATINVPDVSISVLQRNPHKIGWHWNLGVGEPEFIETCSPLHFMLQWLNGFVYVWLRMRWGGTEDRPTNGSLLISLTLLVSADSTCRT